MRRTIQRALPGAVLAGAIVDTAFLVLFPHFFTHAVELLLAPAVFLVPALMIGAVAGAAGRARGPRRTPPGRARNPALRAALAAALALPLLLFLVRAPARAWRVEPKLFVVGFDGATWDVIRPLMERGELPGFASLVETGTTGELQSAEPSFSPVLWNSIATGMHPERHGITSFYAGRAQLRKPRLWRRFADAGASVGVFRWFVTWPPQHVNGFMVPSILARTDETWPPEYGFIQQLRNAAKGGRALDTREALGFAWQYLRHGLRLETVLAAALEFRHAGSSRDPRWVHAAMRCAETRLNADMFAHLVRRYRPEYCFFYDNTIDVLSHYYWQYHEPERFDVSPADAAKYGRMVPDGYRHSDRVLSYFLSHLGPETTVMVLSDHGLEAARWAGREMASPRIEPLLATLSMGRHMQGVALAESGYLESSSTDSTTAAKILAVAARELEALRVRETGEPLFEVDASEATRLRVSARPGLSPSGQHVVVAGKSLPLEQLVDRQVGLSGVHHMRAIFAARGPAVKEGHAMTSGTIYDVAPTVLYLMGQPLSREFPGTVLRDAIRPGFLASHAPAWVDSFPTLATPGTEIAPDETIRQQLRSLGYLR